MSSNSTFTLANQISSENEMEPPDSVFRKSPVSSSASVPATNKNKGPCTAYLQDVVLAREHSHHLCGIVKIGISRERTNISGVPQEGIIASSEERTDFFASCGSRVKISAEESGMRFAPLTVNATNVPYLLPGNSSRQPFGGDVSEDYLSTMGDDERERQKGSRKNLLMVRRNSSDEFLSMLDDESAVFGSCQGLSGVLNNWDGNGQGEMRRSPSAPNGTTFVDASSWSGEHLSSLARQRFLLEPMTSNDKVVKGVEVVPGISREYAQRLREEGIGTVKKLYGHFLISPHFFQEFLISLGIDPRNAERACQALEEWDANHN